VVLPPLWPDELFGREQPPAASSSRGTRGSPTSRCRLEETGSPMSASNLPALQGGSETIPTDEICLPLGGRE
jgi:hypothetical protein